MSPPCRKKSKKKPYKRKFHSEIQLVCLGCVTARGERRFPKFFKGKLFENNGIVCVGLDRHLSVKHLCANHYKSFVENKHANRFTTSRVDLQPVRPGTVSFTVEQFGLTSRTWNYSFSIARI